MPLPDAMIESRLDLSSAQVAEPAPGRLVVTSLPTPARRTAAGALGLLCLLFACLIWRQRGAGWFAALYPLGPIALVFALIAVVLAFGGHVKTLDAGRRQAEVRAWLGPLCDARTYPLPPTGQLRLTLRREAGSSKTKAPSVRWYDLDVAGLPALGFTLPSDRDAARAFAARLSAALGYDLVDEVEDDGVTRLPR